jgi:hypothetical protein
VESRSLFFALFAAIGALITDTAFSGCHLRVNIAMIQIVVFASYALIVA